jgi:thymidylate synthase
MIQKEMQLDIASKLGIVSGPLACFSHSAHIYENKWADAIKLLDKSRQAQHSGRIRSL